MRRTWIVAGVAVAGLAGAFFLWPDRPVPVVVAKVVRGDVELVVSNTRAGTVSACRRSRLSMPMGGRVERLQTREGGRVRAGDILLEVWNDDRQAQLAQATAATEGAALREQ